PLVPQESRADPVGIHHGRQCNTDSRTSATGRHGRAGVVAELRCAEGAQDEVKVSSHGGAQLIVGHQCDGPVEADVAAHQGQHGVGQLVGTGQQGRPEFGQLRVAGFGCHSSSLASARRPDQGINTVEPWVLRPSRSRWAWAASCSRYRSPVVTVIVPAWTAANNSSVRQANSSYVRRKCGRSGRVRYTEPAAFSRCGSTGGTGPLDAPYNASVPRTARLARLASNVDLPTPSYTAATPAPPVSERIFAPNVAGSSGYPRTSTAPARRDNSAFARVERVVITRAPRLVAHCVRINPTPPAPACSKTVSPESTGYTDLMSRWAV